MPLSGDFIEKKKKKVKCQQEDKQGSLHSDRGGDWDFRPFAHATSLKSLYVACLVWRDRLIADSGRSFFLHVRFRTSAEVPHRN